MDEGARGKAIPDSGSLNFETDEAWRRYLASRDEEAFAEVVRTYHGLVYSVCQRGLGADCNDVEDAVQDTFCKLALNAEKITTSLSGWLYRCARNTTTSSIRERSRRRRREAAWAAERERAQVDPDQLLTRELDEAIDGLDDADRMLIVEHFLVGRSQTEIAHALRVTPSAVSKRLSRALESLRARLAQLGVTITGPALVGSLAAESARATAGVELAFSATRAALPEASPIRIASFDWLKVTSQLSPKALIAGATALTCLMIGVLSYPWLRVQPRGVAPPGTLTNRSGHVGDSFGEAIAVSGSHALVGAPGDSAPRDAAAVFAYRFDNGRWFETQEIEAPLGAGSHFGGSIALSDETAAIGIGNTRNARQSSQPVHLYEHQAGRWIALQTLHPEGDPRNRFGCSLALSGDHLLVGAVLDDGAAKGAGAVYTYLRKDGEWSLTGKLIPPGRLDHVGFGWQIAIDGEYAAVAAPNDDEGGSLAGAAYVYRLVDGRWRESQKLMASNGLPGSRFGESLAIDDGVIAIGAADLIVHSNVFLKGPEAVVTGREIGSGRVYVFELRDEEWRQQQVLSPGQEMAGARFGWHLALRGDTLVVTAPLASDSRRFHTGAAYVFRRRQGRWTQRQLLRPTATEEFSGFGDAAAVGDGTILVGSAGGNGEVNNGGTFYGDMTPSEVKAAVSANNYVRHQPGRAYLFNVDRLGSQ